MKRTFAVLFLTLSLSTIAFGQTKADEEELTRLDNELGLAGMKGDAATLERFYADDFNSLNPNDPQTKKQSIDAALRNAADVKNPTYTSENYSINFIDPNTAVMTHTGTAKGMFKGEEFVNPHRAMHVWVKRGGQWKLFASMGAPLSDEAVLAQMTRDGMNAVKRRDTAWMEKHYADEYTWVDPGGGISDKSEDIAQAKNLTFDSMELSDMRVRVVGDTGVVTSIVTIKGKHMENDISGKYRLTDTYVKRNGEWKLLAAQATPVAPAQPASN